jgi:diaminohydroxyphosphoribosylaminopyrimidine deaminase/5-amino-6-(5-phosphoribosylamino)uracil reductase
MTRDASTAGVPARTASDHALMARALQLAARGQYSTAPNPSVGCVLLDAAGQVVGEGWHVRAGGPHAEIIALREAGDRARGGTAYVTLEPCSHHGRTPPCVEALLAAGIARVIAAMQDPNPRVAGAGVRRLTAAGVAVDVGLLEREARELNRGFVSRMARGRPWVTVKLGASIDGRTALADGSSRWITSDAARADVQRLRARAAAVLTGIGTVLADDPSLTVRDPALDLQGRDVLRVVCDARGQMPASARVVTDGRATLLFTSGEAEARLRAQGLASATVTIETAPADAAGRLELEAVLRRLAELECNELLVEAGPRLAGSVVAAGLADEIVLYLAPTLLGDTARAAFALPEPLRSLAERRLYLYQDVRVVGDDLRVTLRPREGSD